MNLPGEKPRVTVLIDGDNLKQSLLRLNSTGRLMKDVDEVVIACNSDSEVDGVGQLETIKKAIHREPGKGKLPALRLLTPMCANVPGLKDGVDIALSIEVGVLVSNRKPGDLIILATDDHFGICAAMYAKEKGADIWLVRNRPIYGRDLVSSVSFPVLKTQHLAVGDLAALKEIAEKKQNWFVLHPKTARSMRGENLKNAFAALREDRNLTAAWNCISACVMEMQLNEGELELAVNIIGDGIADLQRYAEATKEDWACNAVARLKRDCTQLIEDVESVRQADQRVSAFNECPRVESNEPSPSC